MLGLTLLHLHHRRLLAAVVLLAVALVLNLAGCGGRRPAPPPGAGYGKIPASQRPYRVYGRTYYPIPSAHGYRADGIASWYGRDFHGRKTASGERYNMYAMTAAHRILPLGTEVKVTNLLNRRTVKVRINDRGPFVRGRIIDLSYRAAKDIGLVGPGTAPVRVEAVGQPALPGIDETPPVFHVGPFTIQVGAFTEKDRADRLAGELSRRYQGQALVITFDDGRRVFHRVRVFNLASRQEAEERLEQLARDGYGDGMIVAMD